MEAYVDKVREIIEGEAAAPKLVRVASEVPGSYEVITPEWLTDILCKSVPGAKVTSFSLGERDDGSSNRRRISLQYNDTGANAGLPASVFCKATTAIDTRTVLSLTGVAQAEVAFYNQVRPKLDLLAPEAYYAKFDPESLAYMVMMKDIGDVAQFPDERHETTRAQAESMVDTLARLHSRFYESPEIDTLPYKPWSEWWAGMMAAVPEWAPSCDKAFVDSEHVMPARLFRRRAEVWPKTMASAEAHNHLPQTLLHSDVHLKNWFLLTKEDKMGLHDWQIMTIGHWSRDLIYSLTTALSIENRRAWLDDLFALYLDKMAERGVAKVPMDDLKRNIRQQLMTSLSFWTITLRPAPGMADMQPERSTWEFLKRLYAAIDDLDALDAFD